MSANEVHERNKDPYRLNVECSKWRLRNKTAKQYAKGRVLDVGCGYGYSSRNYASYVGIDVDPDVIDEAKRLNPQHDFIVASATSLPFPDNSFDTVLCLEVIEHLDDYHQFLTEARRVLSPGGVLIVSTPNPNKYPNPYHVREIAYSELRSAISIGFDVSEARGYSVPWYYRGLFVYEAVLTVLMRVKLPESVIHRLLRVTDNHPDKALNYFVIASKRVSS